MISVYLLLDFLHCLLLSFTQLSHVVQVRAEGPKAPSPGRVLFLVKVDN